MTMISDCGCLGVGPAAAAGGDIVELGSCCCGEA